MTNRERMEKMTDEELGRWLCKHFDCEQCPMFEESDCYWTNPLHKWLKAEDEDD